MRGKGTNALEGAIKSEADPKAKRRMRSVLRVLKGSERRNEAKRAKVNYNTICIWVKRHEDWGAEGLRDLPKPGRTPKADPDIIERLAAKLYAKGRLTPDNLRDAAAKKAGYRYSGASIRRMLYRFGYVGPTPRPSRMQKPWKRARKARKN